MCRYRPILSLMIASALLAQVGCALNIPSQRFHDPTDHGGIFGHWDKPGSGQSHLRPPGGFHGTACVDGGSHCACDPLDPRSEESYEPNPPEVPWPRFHPVPTRPVFGGTLGSVAN